MHYPVITEKELSERWKLSVKTLQRWRAKQIGPVWHKLFRHVRYRKSDIIAFERQSAQHLIATLGRDIQVSTVKSQPPPETGKNNNESNGSPTQYVSATEMAAIVDLPHYLFSDRQERLHKRIPHMSLVGTVRFSLDEVFQWELANSVLGHTSRI